MIIRFRKEKIEGSPKEVLEQLRANALYDTENLEQYMTGVRKRAKNKHGVEKATVLNTTNYSMFLTALDYLGEIEIVVD
jgi:hypothetical protein